jgi:hypothetical protein
MNCYRGLEASEPSCNLCGHGGVMKHIATPNPSIEGMPKRLRLSVTPHVKR